LKYGVIAANNVIKRELIMATLRQSGAVKVAAALSLLILSPIAANKAQ
jgi:hypothetical protein